jgi:hypothetical protein
MKMSRYSKVATLGGLAVGLLAMWAVAAPVGLSGDLITGATWTFSNGDAGGYHFACPGTCYQGMDGSATTLNCSDSPGGECHGGSFTGAQYGPGMTTRSSRSNGLCDGTSGNWQAYWDCEYYLVTPTFGS